MLWDDDLYDKKWKGSYSYGRIRADFRESKAALLPVAVVGLNLQISILSFCFSPNTGLPHPSPQDRIKKFSLIEHGLDSVWSSAEFTSLGTNHIFDVNISREVQITES